MKLGWVMNIQHTWHHTVCMAILLCATGCPSPQQDTGTTPTEEPAATQSPDNGNRDTKDTSQGAIEPMAVGNAWVYQVSDGNGSSWQIRRTITATRDLDGETAYHYSVVDLTDGSEFEGYDQVLRKDGIYSVFAFDGVLRKQVPLRPKIGDLWKFPLGGVTETYTVTSTDEPVTTPAGTFKCTVVVNEVTDEKGPHKATFYFARGVGLVRTHYDDGGDEQLIEYKLAERQPNHSLNRNGGRSGH